MFYRALCVAMVALVLFTGCATAPSIPTTAATAPKAAAETPKPAATGQASPTAKPATSPAAKAPSGTLVSALSSFGEDTLDPIYGGLATVLAGPMFEFLTDYDPTGKLGGRIAESWTYSPDAMVVTFKVRKGIKFHNGDEVTAEDVKFSFERLMSQKSRSPWTTVYRNIIDKIETPDASTVVVTLKSVDTNFVYTTSGLQVMPKKYIESKGEDGFADSPVGTGPWKFVKHEPGASVEYEAVPNHWRSTPAFQKLVLKLVPEESTRTAMLKRGEIDIMEISLDNIEDIKSSGFDIRFGVNESQVAVLFPGVYQNSGTPTMDLKVRQALSLAINRDELAKTFFKGYASPSVRTWMTSTNWGWDSTWKPEPYDPQKAKQLLADAGYPNKFSDPVINLWSYQAAGAGWLPQVAQIVSGYWEAVGVKTKLTPIDAASIRTMYVAKPPDPKIVGTALPYLAGSVPSFTYFHLFNLYNSAGTVDLLHDPEWDALYNSIAKEVDDGKRVALFQQAMNKSHEQYVDIKMVGLKLTYAVSNKVGEWRGFGQGSIIYDGIQPK